MSILTSGAVIQGGLNHQSADYYQEHISFPVIGVVQNVFFADDDFNTLTVKRHDRKAHVCQARILVLNDGSSSPTILPNVMVLPQSGTGSDDFHEEIPKGTTGTIDGTPLAEDTQPWKLNGDWCVVHFIGGSIHQPVMLNWFPHPGNHRDSATKDVSKGNLAQGRRWVKRFSGARLAITSKGTLILDTNESNSPLNTDLRTRELSEEGGDLKINIKNSRKFEMNFNPSVFDETEPDFLYTPSVKNSPQSRKEIASQLLADKDFIKELAGRVIQIAGNQDGTDHNDTVLLGQTPTDHIIKGDKHKITYDTFVAAFNALVTSYNAHIHQTGPGPGAPTSTPAAPSSIFITVPQGSLGGGQPPNDIYSTATPEDPSGGASNMPATDLSEVVKTE